MTLLKCPRIYLIKPRLHKLKYARNPGQTSSKQDFKHAFRPAEVGHCRGAPPFKKSWLRACIGCLSGAYNSKLSASLYMTLQTSTMSYCHGLRCLYSQYLWCLFSFITSVFIHFTILVRDSLRIDLIIILHTHNLSIIIISLYVHVQNIIIILA